MSRRNFPKSPNLLAFLLILPAIGGAQAVIDPSKPRSDVGRMSGVFYDITHEVPIEQLNPDGIRGYHYASFGKPDPFLPPLLANKLERDTTLADELTVLQTYSVSELSVSGIWKLTNGESKALIMTPKSEAVITKVGDSIGKKGGVAVEITPYAVVVREHSFAPDGTRIFADTLMGLGDNVIQAQSTSASEKADSSRKAAANSPTESTAFEVQTPTVPSLPGLSNGKPVVGGTIPTK